MKTNRFAVARVGDKALELVGDRFHNVRRVRRPGLSGPGESLASEFDLAYVRTGPQTGIPTVVIPGGPGLGSVFPYGDLRRQAAGDGLDIIMIEHRGVGLSRTDLSGADLPQSTMWIEAVLDDIAAVLDQEGVGRAFIAGSSYGSYLASSFGVKYPGRVAGMLLDSALQSTADIQIERAAMRALFWEGEGPAAQDVRALVERGEDQRVLGDVLRVAYELCGMEVAQTMVRRRLGDLPNPVWNLLATYSSRDASTVGIPGFYEFGRVGAIGFRELGFGPKPDGKPLDAGLTYSLLAPDFPQFEGEPFDLLDATAGFDWPVVLLAGDRDLRTPAEIAMRTAELAPQAVVVSIQNGHSALDTHMLAFEKTLKLLVRGQVLRIVEVAPALDSLPKRGAGAQFAALVQATARFTDA